MKIAVFILFICLIVAPLVYSATPNLINYQGRLTDTLGYAVPDGNYSVTFRIYDDSLSSSALWTEGQLLTVKDGLFAVLLGAVVPFTDTTFSDSVRWLGAQVGLDPEISPRARLVSVPFAIEAQHAEAANSSIYSDTANHAFTIEDSSVSTEKLADDAVTGDKIQNGTIQFEDIGQNSADSGQIMKWSGSNWVAEEDREYSIISPGIAYVTDSFFYFPVYESTVVWMELTITTPADGIIKLEGSGTAGSGSYLSLDTIPARHHDYALSYLFRSNSGGFYWAHILPVSAGTHAFYLNVMNYGALIEYRDGKLVATFYPVNYGE